MINIYVSMMHKTNNYGIYYTSKFDYESTILLLIDKPLYIGIQTVYLRYTQLC